MKHIVLIVFLLFAGQLWSQHHGTVAGTILDAERYNEPLLYANVAISDSSLKAQTNFHGNFEISGIDPGSYTLIISYPGYKTINVPIVVAESEAVRITKGLHPMSISLDDMVLLTESSHGLSSQLTAAEADE